MHLADSDLDSFCSWLCEHEHEVVGRSGMTYHCPLALWLSERSGHTYGVDGRVYGRASCAYHCWRLLPRSRGGLCRLVPRYWPFVQSPAARHSSCWRVLNWRCRWSASDELKDEFVKEGAL